MSSLAQVPLAPSESGDVVLVSVPKMFSRYLTLDPADGVVKPLTRDVAPGLAASFVPYLTAHYAWYMRRGWAKTRPFSCTGRRAAPG